MHDTDSLVSPLNSSQRDLSGTDLFFFACAFLRITNPVLFTSVSRVRCPVCQLEPDQCNDAVECDDNK